MLINTLEKPVTFTDYKSLSTCSSVLNMTKTEAHVLLDWVKTGMSLPTEVVTQALLLTGDLQTYRSPYKPSGAALGATLEGYASRPLDRGYSLCVPRPCLEMGSSGTPREAQTPT